MMESKEFKIRDLIDTYMRSFSQADVNRSQPLIKDGLTWIQRRVIFAFENCKDGSSAASKGGRIGDEIGYLPSPNTVAKSIVAMTRKGSPRSNIDIFVESDDSLNNLKNISTRYFTGIDHFSPYVRTSLFRNNDNASLELREENGCSYEPKWYLPVVPIVLVRGAAGISSGYRFHIPPYKLSDVISNMKNHLNDLPLLDIEPSFKNFDVDIIKESEGAYVAEGKLEYSGRGNILVVKSLPQNRSVAQYKKVLRRMAVKRKNLEQAKRTSFPSSHRFSSFQCPASSFSLPHILKNSKSEGYSKKGGKVQTLSFITVAASSFLSLEARKA